MIDTLDSFLGGEISGDALTNVVELEKTFTGMTQGDVSLFAKSFRRVVGTGWRSADKTWGTS